MQIKIFLKKCQAQLSSATISSFLFGMLGAAIVLIFSHLISPKQEKIATINITKIVDEFIKEENSKHLEPDLMKQEVKKFGQQLESNLKTFAKRNHLILLPNEAVIAGSEDYTYWFAVQKNKEEP
jgi:hypothetical protein